MPGTTAFAGPGFQWLVDIGTTGNFIPIAYSQDIEGPTISRNMADISNQTSQLGKEVKPALIDNGTITRRSSTTPVIRTSRRRSRR